MSADENTIPGVHEIAREIFVRAAFVAYHPNFKMRSPCATDPRAVAASAYVWAQAFVDAREAALGGASADDLRRSANEAICREGEAQRKALEDD